MASTSMATPFRIHPLLDGSKHCICMSCSASSRVSGKGKRKHESMIHVPTGSGSGSSMRGFAGDSLLVTRTTSSVRYAAVEAVSVARKSNHLEFLTPLVPSLAAAVVALSTLFDPPVSLGQTVDIQRGAALFRRACIGCHDAGGNIIQPGATLFAKDLQRNGVVAEEEIFKVTYFGKGRMPGFGENCTPRGQCTFGPRLQEEDIKVLAKFVKVQADQGWVNNDMISQD